MKNCNKTFVTKSYKNKNCNKTFVTKQKKIKKTFVTKTKQSNKTFVTKNAYNSFQIDQKRISILVALMKTL